MADLKYTFSDYYTLVSEFLGLGSSPTGTNLTKVKNLVYRGYRSFLYPTKKDLQTGKRIPHHWSFLKRYYTFTTEGDKWKYALPEDFGRIITDPEYSEGEGFATLRKRSPEFILNQRMIVDSSSWPTFYAIVNSDYDLEIGTTWEMWLHETPNSDYTFHFFYKIHVPKPTGDSEYLVGGIEAQEAILESCLAAAELQEEDMTSTIHTQKAAELIEDLMAADDIDKGKSIGRILDPRIQEYGKDINWRSTLRDVNDDNIYA